MNPNLLAFSFWSKLLIQWMSMPMSALVPD